MKQELPKGKWFCSTDCTRIHSALQKLLIRGPEKLPDSLLEAVSRKLGKNSSDNKVDVDVSWRLISGKIASPETRLLLSEAIAIFHVSFPIFSFYFECLVKFIPRAIICVQLRYYLRYHSCFSLSHMISLTEIKVIYDSRQPYFYAQ